MVDTTHVSICISNLLTVLELDWQAAHLLKSIGYLTKASFVWSFSKPKGKHQDHWLTLVSKFRVFLVTAAMFLTLQQRACTSFRGEKRLIKWQEISSKKRKELCWWCARIEMDFFRCGQSKAYTVHRRRIGLS